MSTEQMFVQFIHPGPEHMPGPDGTIGWNTGAHRRKYLRILGDYVPHLADGEPLADELEVWAEWEPPSQVIAPIDGPPGYPHVVWLPQMPQTTPSTFVGLQNTDPLIFGSEFRYTNCQQNTVRGATFLRNLPVGSVVLFGSNLGGEFVLDTLLVVRESREHDRLSYHRLREVGVENYYFDVTLEPSYQNNVAKDQCFDYRLYRGATAARRMNGMFSFAPAKVASGAPGFSRPPIRLPGLITPSLRQGKKGTRLPLPELIEAWSSVARQVLARNLMLGVRFDLPSVGASSAMPGQVTASSTRNSC